METTIKVQNFIDQVVDGKIICSQMETSQDDLDVALKQLLSDFQTTVAQGKLGQQILILKDFVEDVSFRLESGIINLPFANVNRVDSFFEDVNVTVPLQVEFIMEAEDLNASHFHIDQIGTFDELNQAPMKMANRISELSHSNLEKIQQNLTEQEEKKD